MNAFGGWVSQLVDGVERPITYESRKLRPAERNYSPYNGELLALVHCLWIFRAYLVNRPDIDHTDHFMDNVCNSLEPEFTSLISRLRRGKADMRYSLCNGLIWFNNTRLLIPEKLQLKV